MKKKNENPRPKTRGLVLIHPASQSLTFSYQHTQRSVAANSQARRRALQGSPILPVLAPTPLLPLRWPFSLSAPHLSYLYLQRTPAHYIPWAICLLLLFIPLLLPSYLCLCPGTAAHRTKSVYMSPESFPPTHTQTYRQPPSINSQEEPPACPELFFKEENRTSHPPIARATRPPDPQQCLRSHVRAPHSLHSLLTPFTHPITSNFSSMDADALPEDVVSISG